MIKEIKIYNRFHMNLMAKDLQLIPYDYWYIISIYDYNDGLLLTQDVISLFKRNGLQKYLSLKFSDLTDKNYSKIKKHYAKTILFQKKHANKIIEFVKDIQADQRIGILIIHCNAGISRSGAVGTFVCDYCGLNYGEFLKSNRYIMANQYVLSLLKKTAGITPVLCHDGIDSKHDQEIINPFH